MYEAVEKPLKSLHSDCSSHHWHLGVSIGRIILFVFSICM